MATAMLPIPGAPTAPSIWPYPFRWTCEPFEQLRHSGWVEGRKLILIDGEILEMAFPGPLHDTALELCDRWLRSAFPASQYCVRGQMGLFFGINTDPVPDLAVVAGTPRTLGQTPRTALLVIEIADTSVGFDTKEKASLYAAAGIQDYWVINLVDLRLHVFRTPQPDTTRKYGHWYGHVQGLSPTDSVAPLAAPNSSVLVADLLP